MNARVLAHAGRGRARRAANGSTAEGAARAGLTARGVIYLLVGVLALQIAFGTGDRQADRGGALAELADKPFGAVLLWALGIGLVGMALWRLTEALFGVTGKDGRTARKRLPAAARCVFYAFVAYSVLAFAAGSGGGGSSDRQSRDVTAKVMEMPAGQWLVGLAGAGIAVAGVVIAVQALRRSYHKKLKLGELNPGLGGWSTSPASAGSGTRNRLRRGGRLRRTRRRRLRTRQGQGPRRHPALLRRYPARPLAPGPRRRGSRAVRRLLLRPRTLAEGLSRAARGTRGE